jgi:hypothetical protein
MTSTVVHVHDHDYVHDYVSRRRDTFLSARELRRGAPPVAATPRHSSPTVKFPGYYV